MTKVLHNLNVYNIAIYYNIPRLESKAYSNIGDIIRTNWSAENFSNIVREISNLSRDEKLRNIMVHEGVEHLEELVKCEDLLSDIMGHIGIGIIQEMVEKAEKLEVNLRIAQSILDDAFQTLNRITICPSKECKAKIGCYVAFEGGTFVREYVEHVPKYKIRCRWCNCRLNPAPLVVNSYIKENRDIVSTSAADRL